ncbi:NBS-LRR type disease resistance protein [Quillaja saponaria]|uniref:NBS-LRR type disease resistance protein n=1 Tax=Quillaja saponaria TaxID=32244 RepID=A0AAD7L1K8_QUISA|nr:NBS-LRR type disease resistance protein [Quillaja saponaria]
MSTLATTFDTGSLQATIISMDVHLGHHLWQRGDFLRQFLKHSTTTARGLQSSSNSSLSLHSPLQIKISLHSGINDLESLQKELLPNLTSLEDLTFCDCPGLKSVSSIPQHISAVHKLRVIRRNEVGLCNDEEDGDYDMRWKELSSFCTLELHDLSKLVSLPKDLQHVTTLDYS